MKRILGSLAVLTAAVALAAPASAAQTTLGTRTYADKAGDAPPRADIRSTKVVATTGAYWAYTRIGNLYGVGQYGVNLTEYPRDARGFRARAVVTKALGKAPVASLFTHTYEDGWVRTPCAMQVGWDMSSDVVRVQVPRRCHSYLATDVRHAVYRADFTANGASDTIALAKPS